MSLGRICRRALSIVVLTVFVTRGASAQRPVDLANATIEELMRISVTTATRTEETLATAPARIEVITADQIRRRGYRSLTDVLKDLVDFKVDLAGDPDYPASITVQGMRGSNFLIVLLDGIRISSPTNEPLPILANYPVHMAQQIEIVYGPASAVYGADAFAGVINIITKKGDSAAGLSVEASTGQSGLFNQTLSYGRRVGKEGSVMLGGQFQYDRQPDMSRYYPADFQGLQGQQTGTFNTIFGPMTPRRPVSAGYEAPLRAHSMQAALNAGGFQASFFANEQRASTTSPYTPENGVYDADAFARNTLAVASLGYVHHVGRASSASTLTVSRHVLEPESGYWNVFSNLVRSYKYAYGSMAKLDEQLTWKQSARLTMSAGATVERFLAIPQTADLNAPVASRAEPGTILDTGITDDFETLRYANTGAYGQLQYAMTSRVSFTLGARGDYNTRYGGTFNPRAGVVLRPATATTVKVLYGTAFLAPSPYESYAHYGSFYSTDAGATYASDYWHLGNPDLRPQQKKTVEVTLLQGLGRSLALSASGFFSKVTDLRQATDADQAYSGTYHGWPVAYIDFPVNEGDETTYGGTVGLELTTSFASTARLNSRVALSAADGRIWRQDGDAHHYVQVGGMVPLQLRATTDLDWGGWSIAPRASLLGRQRTLAIEDRGDRFVRRTLDGYLTLDVHIRRALSSHFDTFVTVENALDARYRHVNLRAFTNPEELVGAPQNPRRVSVGFSVRVP
ncbi:MAG TPA: TonB-dependent receptor [Vicinamibacterales bacterium]|nr:TonB-dependent receptor [Vicinamibacterales bacterium]